ncbi:phage holin family protein [Providencia manganoxydans]|uniref:phage holin family protein n=1 Tax=Providencia manganoxydans TaxID=2923283 RepID=UPI0034DD44EA
MATILFTFYWWFYFCCVSSLYPRTQQGMLWKQSLGEALMCGLLSVGTIRFLEWWLAQSGNTEAWDLLAEFCGVVVGFLGTKKLYSLIELIIQFIKKRFGV